MENYAINVLEKEIDLLKKCLKDWEENHYTEARKDRIKKLSELEEAVKELKL